VSLDENLREAFEQRVRDMVINPSDVSLPLHEPPAGLDLLSGNHEYVIITSSSLEASFDPLLEWKKKKGVSATLVTTEFIYANYSGSSNAERIRNFILDASSTWGSIWFLLGGDISVIPYQTYNYVGDNIPSDFYYSDVDDDWFSEVYVGRASVENPTEVATFVNKILTYEIDPPQTDYALKALFLGFDLDASTYSEIMKDAVDTYYMPARFDPITKVYDSDGGNHLTTAISELNQGHNLVNHSDHCNQYVLGMGYENHGWTMSTSQVAGLTNGDRQSIFYSLGCWTCAYDYNDCIAEYFTKNSGGGAVSYIGNSRYGWYSPGNYNVASMRYDRAFFKSLFNENYYRVGQTLADSKDDNYPYDSYNRYIVCELTLLGDPEMPIWTDTPELLSASHSSTVPQGSSEFTVTVTSHGSPLNQACVCLYKDDDVYEVGYTDASGEVVLTVEPDSFGTMYVTVTKQNYYPYADSALVGGLPSPDLYFPIEGEWVTSTQLWMDWEHVTGYAGYVLHVSALPDFSDTVCLDSTGVDSALVTVPEGLYYWRVWVHDGMGTDGPAAQDSFGVDATLPTAPTLVFPPDGYTTNQLLMIFVWNASVDERSGLLGYLVECAENPEFSGALTWWAQDTTYNEWMDDGDYYWRVRAMDIANNLSEWSEVWTFSIDSDAPDPPILYAPVDGEWLVDTEVFFDWSEVSSCERNHEPLPETPVLYVLWVSTTPDFTDTVHRDTMETDSATVTLHEERYYWLVYAIDDGGNIGISAQDSFGVDQTGPETPSLVAPSNCDTLSVGISESVTFVWNTADDGISGVESYELYYTDTTVLCAAPETSYVLTPFPLTELVWRVRALDVAGNLGAWSEEWSLAFMSVKEGSEHEKPSCMALSGCWPNPSRGDMTIEYNVPKETRVRVKVFDVSGRLLDVLVDDTRSASVHRTVWTGRDASGAKRAAGVYYITMEAGGRLFTQKILRIE
jgi:hypothetical protein